MPKPDDRSDNVERIAHAIDNTMENLRDSRDTLKAHGDEMHEEDKMDLKAKNERREEAIEGFRREIKDEARHQSETD